MNLPRITPVMLREQPDQTCDTLNRLVAYIQDESNGIKSRLDDFQIQINKINDKIDGLDERIAALEQNPTPGTEYVQIVLFNSANMGTTPGWCLANADAGFGITGGTFPNARADWESQQTNGTLHTGYPPSYLQVPVYADTGTSNGHVVVWDRGTVWSDGVVVPDGLSHYANVIGWGELLDGVRVVQRI